MDMSSLYDATCEVVKPPKKPTYLQYLKESTKAMLGQTFQVECIWIPNRYNNYTLDTHAWRLRLVENDPVFILMSEFTKNLDGSKEAIGIKVTDKETGAYIFQPMKSKKGYWKKLGDKGFIFNED